MALLDLDLEDADIGVTDLRDPRKLAENLQKRQRLRVRKGNETIGVFVSAPAWRELQERFNALQAELDARDDEALSALLSERIDDNESWVAGSAKSAAGVISSYQQILKQRRGR